MCRWVAGRLASSHWLTLSCMCERRLSLCADFACTVACCGLMCPALRFSRAGVQGSGERIGMDVEATFAGIAAKRARLPTWGGEGSYEQAGGLEQGGSPGGVAAPPEADANEAQEPWELALLDDAPPGGSMSEAFLRQQQQVFAELRASGSGAGTAQRQHAAIFGLAAALLEGPAQQ